MQTEPLDFDETHEWVSFEHGGGTWMFDVTFLTSNWSCIWNEGCLGIHEEPTPERAEGCCSFGAHFTEAADYEKVAQRASELSPDQWQFTDHGGEPFHQDEGGVWHTVLVDGACVFLNRPGFDGGHGCALHRAATEADQSILTWKPAVCWQLPLRLEHHTDENGHDVATLRQWRRHDWGEGGADFHWWCTEDHLAFVDHTPVYERLNEEIVGLVGQPVADRLAHYLDSRGVAVFLPHPATRQRSS